MFIIFTSVLILSCSKRYNDLPTFSALPIRDYANQSVGRFKTTYLADQIHAYFRGHINGPIAVTTFVSIDDLYQTSTFGRMLGEQLLSELAMQGYNVVEMRLSDALQIMQNGGELGLSRETKTLKNNFNVSALVVGTYVASPNRVYVNARIVDPSTSMIISAGSVEMEKTEEITRLLRSGSFPSTMERIPVRHLGYANYPLPYYYPAWLLPPSNKLNDNTNEEWNMESQTPGQQSLAPKASLPHTGS